MPRMRTLAARSSAAAALIAALVAVTLAGCASGGAGADAADPTVIAERAGIVGIAPDLVYTTEVDGYDLAPQSVGVGAAEGMSATWFNGGTGAMVTIRSDHGEMTAASCPDTPLWEAPDGPVVCTESDGVWHRQSGETHEYTAVRDGVLIRVSGVDAPPADLEAAAKAVRVPSNAELELLFSDLPEVPPTPVERGDLPDNGDGAPIDQPGEGG